MKKIILLLFLVTGVFEYAQAQDISSGDFNYYVNSPGRVTLVNTVDYELGGDVTIPGSVDYENESYTVTEIAPFAFYTLNISSVTIPNTVTTIGYYAFAECHYLASITIGNSVTSIGDNAFGYLRSLNSVICNVSTPISIDEGVFTDIYRPGCSLTVPNGSLAAYQAAEIWQDFNIIIGDDILNTTTVTACSSYTWANNNETYTETGVYTGTTTNGVTEQLDLTILSNLSIDGINYVFTSPTTVEVGLNPSATGEIIIPETVDTDCGTYSVTSIGNNAFEESSGITNITIPNSVTNIGDFAFFNCSDLTLVNIPNSVTQIGSGAFRGCTGLTSVTIPNSIASISSATFRGCTGLTSVTIPNSVSYIDDNAFRGCTGLTSVTIPNSVTYIGSSIFSGCTGLTSVTISNSVTSIGSAAFRDCSNLTSVTIPNSVTSIDSGAFRNCSNLTSVTIPNSVTSIGDSAFRNCSNLTSVTIPNSVTSIGDSAFADCTSLTSVTIPNSVTSIGGSAFANCTSLTSVICNVSSPLNIDSSVFGGVNQAGCSLTVPAGTEAAYQAAPIWQDFINSANPPVTTKIKDSQCGSTLLSLNTAIVAKSMTNATGYRFKVVNGTTNETIEGVDRFFRLTSLPGGTFYNTTYTISVATKYNNVWGEYGEECTVSTPAFPLTKVKDSQCGSTLLSLTTAIVASSITNATGYRFKVVNGTTNEIIEGVNRFFNLTSLQGGTFYNTTYTVSVATKYNGVWSDYGNECSITTPAFPLTKVKDSQCGSTLLSLTTAIVANSITNATGYRFKVVNGTTNEIIEGVNRFFNLTSLPGGTFYDTTYTISVATKYNNVWSDYGNECTVTSPAAPLTKLMDKQCGMTLTSGNGTILYATEVYMAQKYRFAISLGADVYTYDTASSNEINFRMTSVPGLTLMSDTTYTVRVAIMINGVWQPYGESCNVTTFGDAPNFFKTHNVDTNVFNVVTYPSPFSDNFNLNLTSISEEKVTVMVYDMTGKLMEKKEIVPSELSKLQVGNNFASGIYNVIVSQGENTKSLRVIKK